MGQQRAADPPGENQHRPFRQMLIPVQAEPDPRKIGEAIAHRHPQQHLEKAVALGDAPAVAEQVENAVVHCHVHKPTRKVIYFFLKSSSPPKRKRKTRSK